MRPAVVLGCRPGPCLRRRVDAAVRLWRSGATDRMVVSGAGEAGIAIAWCVAAGVPGEVLVAEPLATSTRENVARARALLGPGPVWLVTDDWHLRRAAALCRRAGLDPHPWPTGDVRLRPLLRECVSCARALAAGHLRPRDLLG